MPSVFLTEDLKGIVQEKQNANVLFYVCSYKEENRTTLPSLLSEAGCTRLLRSAQS